AILDSFLRNSEYIKYMQYSDFYKLQEIGSGGYGTVYTAKYKGTAKYRGCDGEEEDIPETVVLKRFKSFDETPELFISELSNNNWVVSIKVTFNLTLYLLLFNSLEIMPSA